MGCPTRNRKHRNHTRCTIELQQPPAAEDLLLICCKSFGRVARGATGRPGFIE
jgi:hypothetical protein